MHPNNLAHMLPYSRTCDRCGDTDTNADLVKPHGRYECDRCQRDYGSLRTTLQPNGEWSAIDDDTYDGPGSLIGWGRTEQEAIADLLSQLEDRP